jgi:hypothetical protein
MKKGLFNRLHSDENESKNYSLDNITMEEIGVGKATNTSTQGEVCVIIDTPGYDEFTKEKALTLIDEEASFVVNLEDLELDKHCNRYLGDTDPYLLEDILGDSVATKKKPKSKKHKFIKNGVAGVFNKNKQLRKQAPVMVNQLFASLNITKK